MICPLLTHVVAAAGIFGKDTTRDCLTEECAWWIQYIDNKNWQHKRCAVVGIFEHLEKMANTIYVKAEVAK
jgi:hypothetical protein